MDRSRCACHICYSICQPMFVEMDFVLAHTVNPRFCCGDAAEDGKRVYTDEDMVILMT